MLKNDIIFAKISTIGVNRKMEDVLKKLFGAEGKIGLCVKDANRKVVYQNEMSKGLCGDQLSATCKKGCMEHYVSTDECPSRSEGAQVYPNKLIKNQYVDLVLLNNGEDILTMVYPVSNKHEKELSYFKDKGLSKREFEIVEMVVHGMTNSEIVKKLAISKATLKTHLNNIYKKLPAESRVGFRRRAMLT